MPLYVEILQQLFQSVKSVKVYCCKYAKYSRENPRSTTGELFNEVIVGWDHRIHRVAMAAFWRSTFHHEGKISPGW
jgi:hypothetical protein